MLAPRVERPLPSESETTGEKAVGSGRNTYGHPRAFSSLDPASVH